MPIDTKESKTFDRFIIFCWFSLLAVPPIVWHTTEKSLTETALLITQTMAYLAAVCVFWFFFWWLPPDRRLGDILAFLAIFAFLTTVFCLELVVLGFFMGHSTFGTFIEMIAQIFLKTN